MPIDQDFLLHVAFGDSELARELLTIYSKRSAKIVGALRLADVTSPASLGDLAHAIRGSALAVGAADLAEIALEAERTLRNGRGGAQANWEKVAVLVAAIERSADEAADLAKSLP